MVELKWKNQMIAVYMCHTPNLTDLQRNGIPGGVCHSITVTVTLNDLKCRLENTAFDH